jgi:hypothetical protein
LGGTEKTTQAVLDVTGSNAIVDWVFIEMRSKLQPTSRVLTRSALLQRDGDIVDVDGVSPLLFKAKTDDYYVTIRHRNHLGIMSAEPVAFTREKAAPTTADFTTTTAHGTNPQKIVGNYKCLWGGNADASSAIVYQGFGAGLPDRDNIFFTVLMDPLNTNGSFNFISKGYLNADTNMDGKVKFQGGGNNDVDQLIFFNVLQHPANTNHFINYIISQQLP